MDKGAPGRVAPAVVAVVDSAVFDWLVMESFELMEDDDLMEAALAWLSSQRFCTSVLGVGFCRLFCKMDVSLYSSSGLSYCWRDLSLERLESFSNALSNISLKKLIWRGWGRRLYGGWWLRLIRLLVG